MLIDRLLASVRARLAALRSRPGIIASLAIHLALIALLIGVHPARTPTQKRGDALIVELPNMQEPANIGQPGPAPGAVPAPAVPEPKARPTPPARPAPPAPKQAAPPSPRPQVAARPKAEEPREAPRTPPSRQQPPPAAERGDVPAAKSAPAEPTPQVAKAAPEPTPEPARPDPPAPPAPPAVASAPPSPPGPVAMVPPAPPDIRSALRRGGGGGPGSGGAGGTGAGRGGIEGEPVALDSKDPNFSDYLERVRALIKKHWSYPCVKNLDTRECEYKNGQLVIEFGILRNGQLGFVELHRSSGHVIMDDYAANAIKLASPFPAIPPALLQSRKGAGLPILARFNYVVENSLTNVLR